MRITKDQIPAKFNVPGALARVITDFGDVTGFGNISGEYFSLGAGTDIGGYGPRAECDEGLSCGIKRSTP